MSIVRQGTLPVGSLDHAITLNVQSSGESHFETVTNTTPYLHRASPQDVASSMKLKKVVGGTIAWNQLNPYPKFENGKTGYSSVGGTFTVADGVAQLVINTAPQYYWECRIQRGIGDISIKGHRYLFSAEATLSVNGKVNAYIGQMSGATVKADVIANQYAELNTIYTSTTTGNGAISVSTGEDFAQRSIGDILYVKKMCVYDLTQMVGSTIADYIYSLEQAHAGDGVAWFKALFGEDYYPYNAGELLSVKTSARKTYNADNVEIGSYALDDDLELRGIPKLDADHSLYYDGDTYASDGTVTRKYGIIDMGDLNWDKYSVQQGTLFRSVVLPNSGTAYDTLNIMCAKYPTTTASERAEKTLSCGSNTRVDIIDSSYSDTSAFKSAMSGVYLVYELATSTTESADAFTLAQRVGATEEFVDGRTVEIPVGNVSEYKRLIQGD